AQRFRESRFIRQLRRHHRRRERAVRESIRLRLHDARTLFSAREPRVKKSVGVEDDDVWGEGLAHKKQKAEGRRQKAEGRTRSRRTRGAPFLTSAFCLLPSAFICLLDKRHLIDLSQRRLPLHHLEKGRLAKECHSFFLRCLLDLRCGPAVENHASNTIGEIEKFRDRGASVEAGAVALQATAAFEERAALVVGRIEAGFSEE